MVERDEIQDILIFLLQNKNEFNSLVLLRYHGLLNLSELAQYLDRSKSNAMVYLNSLEDRDLIEVAPKSVLPEEVQQKRGPKKYYRLTELSKTIFSQVLPQLLQIPFIDQMEEQLALSTDDFALQKIEEIQHYINQSKKEEIDPIVIRSYMLGQINSLMEQTSYEEYVRRLEDMSQLVLDNLANLMKEPTKKDTLDSIMQQMPPSLQLSNLYDIPVHSLDEAKELAQIIINFFRQLEEFKQRSEGKKKPIQGYQHLYLFTGFLNESLFHDE